jgi:hypothetical protein
MSKTNFLGIQRNNNKFMINNLNSSGNYNMENSNNSSKYFLKELKKNSQEKSFNHKLCLLNLNIFSSNKKCYYFF